MITLPPPDSSTAAILADLRGIGQRLKTESPADTIACAYGVGTDVLAWYDESDGRYFDLASLTKPLFTAPAVLGLLAAADGLADGLDEPIATFVDWLPSRPGPGPTIRHLLTHATGLPAELPGEGDVSAVCSWLAECLNGAPVPANSVIYSDANYWLLGVIASSRTGEHLHTLFAKAPTAASGAFRFGQAPAELTVSAGPVTGHVQLPHDGAARRLGPSGHAGAFGTLTGVIHAVMCWLDRGWLRQPVATEAISCQTHATPGGHRSLAWTLAGDPFHAVAHDWPPTTLTHTGFTGVSVALDPVGRWWAVYLSNAIPVARDAGPVLRARRLFHAVAASHLRTTSDPDHS